MRSKIWFLLLLSLVAVGAIKAPDLQFIDNSQQQSQNPGFENGDAFWSATGGSFSVSTTAPLFGNRSASWDPSATAQELSFTAVPVPAGVEGNTCQASFWYKASTFTTGEIKAQVEDGAGNAISASLDLIQQATPKEAFIFFPCPSSGNWHLVFESTADADNLEKLDDIHLGLIKDLVQTSSVDLAVDAEYPATLNCFGWTRTSTTPGAFATDADCPAITVNSSSSAVTVDTADDDLPTLKFSNLSPGKYTVIAMFSAQIVTAGAEATFVLRDVTDSADLDLRGYSDGPTNIVLPFQLVGTFTQTTAGPKHIEIYGYSNTGQIQISNGTVTGFDPQLKFQVIKYSTDEKTAALVQGNDRFLIDANIGGANIVVPVTSSSTYSNHNNAGLSMTLNKGTAFISCNGTEIASASTCTADEVVGIAFTPSRSGRHRVCMQFSHRITLNSTGDARHTFQLIKRQNNDDTVLEAEGNGRVQARAQQGATGVSITNNFPMHVCGEFDLTLDQLATIDLMTERSNNGAVNSAAIEADGSTAEGQRDIQISVEYLETGVNHLVALSNDVVTPLLDGIRVVSATIDYQGTGVPVVDDEFGSWISSITDTAVGDGTVNFITGTFSDVPHCWCGGNDNVFLNCQGLRFADTTQTSFRYRIFDDTGTLFDPVSAGEGVTVYCMGPK